MSNPKGSVATVVVSEAGDGDTTDIQTGIDLLPADGGVVYIREGTYTITNAITITNDNTEIKGAGSSTIIQTVGNIEAISATNVDNISIHDVHIIGSGAGGTNNGIHFTTVTGSIITGCFIDTMGNFCIYLTTTSDTNRIVNNNVSGSRAGIWLDTASSSNTVSNNNINDMNYGAGGGYHGIALLYGSDNNTLIGNIISDCNISGLYSLESERNTFTGNTSSNNSSGIFIWGGLTATSNNIISSNVFSGNVMGANLVYIDHTIIANNIFLDNYYGIGGSVDNIVQDLTYITISGNVFTGQYGNAIKIATSNVHDSNDIVIIGNNFYNNGITGASSIWLADPTQNIYRVIISGNTISTSGNYGIYIETSRIYNTLISNNIFTANTSGNIVDNGTSTQIFNNTEL